MIEDAIPWVFELVPSIISPTTNLSLEDTLKVTTFSSQLSTIPVAESEVTVSPTIKLLVVRDTLNSGKRFCAKILPEEFTASKVPGISLPTSKSETLNDTSPMPPKFSVTPVTENNS